MNDVPYKVLLPPYIKEALHTNSREEVKEMVLEYMKRYPNYQVIRLKNGFIECSHKGLL
jgi:hypothetical protein